MVTMSEHVGAQIKLRREQRGHSLTELARRADIGKGTLSSLEAGRGNPTLDTLDALARALGIPLTDLLTPTASGDVTHVKAEPVLPQEFSRQFMARLSGGHSLEIWRLHMPANDVFDGVPHAPGTVEHMLLVAGSLRAGPVDSPVDLEPGDLVAFSGDVPHRYIAGPDGAEIHFIFATPAVG